MADFKCNFSATVTPLPHFWEHTVGSDHAPMALRADWQRQLRRAHDELGFRHVRFHGLLSDRMGTLICHKEEFRYSFFNADQIFDFLLSIGVKPFIELSFMPETLASGHKTVFNYRGNVTPPKDYRQWATLIRELVSHWVERYGVAEVRTWFFEVWNEPNLHHFWTGTQKDYFKLYRYTVDAIKGVDASLKVGGPGPETLKIEGVERHFCDYLARGVPYGPDDGTLSPWGVVTSLPFAPEIVLPALRYFINHIELKQAESYGFKATFNPTYPVKSGNKAGWVSPWNYGLNQGPIILMVENYRSESLWQLMRRCPYIVKGAAGRIHRRLAMMAEQIDNALLSVE